MAVKKYHKTSYGWQGYQISKLINIILFEKPIEYQYDDVKKHFTYFVNESALDNPTKIGWKERIEEMTGVTIKAI